MSKKLFIAGLIVILLLSLSNLALASGAPYRYATKVDDTYKPYEPDGWVISPDEEDKGDQTVSNAAECDIRGVISCYDEDYLRIDILLNNPISFKWDVFYAVKLEYTDMNEYFTYYPADKELVYEKEKNGKIVETKTLTKNNSDDVAGVTNSDEADNSDVYFILNKVNHVNGKKGDTYFLTCKFLSGYITGDNKQKTADTTSEVDLEFGY